jgi:hypothetical protein
MPLARGKNITSAQGTVGAAAAKIVSAKNGVRAVSVSATHATQDIYVGPSGVTTGNGHKVKAGTTVTLPGFHGDLYAIGSGAGTNYSTAVIS